MLLQHLFLRMYPEKTFSERQATIKDDRTALTQESPQSHESVLPLGPRAQWSTAIKSNNDGGCGGVDL